MKLFQKLLIANAALGLLAPLSASASEVTMNDFSVRKEITATSSRLEGIETVSYTHLTLPTSTHV